MLLVEKRGRKKREEWEKRERKKKFCYFLLYSLNICFSNVCPDAAISPIKDKLHIMAQFKDDISSLSSLLSESRLAQEKKDTQQTQKPVASNPPNIITNRNTVVENLKKSKLIWSDDEICSEDSFVDINDDRPAPRYEFSYKQSVGTEDTFLGMGDKTPLTSDCTHLVIKIHFPNSTMKDLDLDVTKNRIRVFSKTHRLFTYLPVDVDEANGTAKFDPKREVLSVTLPIINSLFG